MRTLSAVIGTLLAAIVIVSIFAMSGVELKYFISPLGIIVVLGGTISAVFLTYSFEDVMRVASISGQIFLRKNTSTKQMASQLLDFSMECRKSGIPKSVGQEYHPFLNDCLVLINDGYSSDEIRDILTKRIDTCYENESYEIEIVNAMAKHPPSFGMIGTVVGLIALMSKLGVESSSGGVDNIGPYLAVALTTTLYGLMISSFVFRPIADNLEIRTIQNMRMREMVLEVGLLIKEKVSYLAIQDTVNALVPPKHQVKKNENTTNRDAA